MNSNRFIQKEFLSSDELIDNSTKARTLNSIKEKIKSLYFQTTEEQLLAILGSLDKLVEDAHIIDMYKFQFKIFTLSIQKEIKNIEDAISA